MVAYSFRPRFVEPILAGTKRQTIRAQGRRRHGFPPDELQLYTGMRTKHCKLIARARCEGTAVIMLDWIEQAYMVEGELPWGPITDEFAKGDGFANLDDMVDFWSEHHPGICIFEGLLITWGELRP